MNILFVEPNFPDQRKSKNHTRFMPIGLVKLASYHRRKGNAICIVKGEKDKNKIFFEQSNGRTSKNLIPDKIMITSYFTYWAEYVKNAVKHYRELYPSAKIIVGGIYASLMPDHCKIYTKCDEVFMGIHKGAEKTPISFTYIEKYYGLIDSQIIHASRGCIRNCDFCGVTKIEPQFTYKRSIRKEIKKEKLVFYDNNLLANPYIENILTELAYLKSKRKIKWCDSQSGIDGRILEKKPDLAFLLKEAGFRNIRISWDGPLIDQSHISKQLKIIEKVGYSLQDDVFIFMLYNWDISYEEMEKKRIQCWNWLVQIADCRYRPLTQYYDHYNPGKYRTGQTGRDYYIHRKARWTDKKIRMFRKHIRRQNMCIRLRIPFYSNIMERKHLNKTNTHKLIHVARNYPKEELKTILDAVKIPYWFPEAYDGKLSNLHVTDSMIYNEFQKLTNKNPFYKNKESSQFQIWRKNQLKSVLKKIP